MYEEIRNYIKDTDINDRLKKPFKKWRKKGKPYSTTYFTLTEIKDIYYNQSKYNFNGFFLTSIDHFYNDCISSKNSNSIDDNDLIEVFDDYDELEYGVRRL